MENKIIPIILGCNEDNNDIIIIYNLFYNIYKLSSNWIEPHIYTNNMVTINNLILIMKNYKDFIKPIFLIYFTGHSTQSGKLKFHNEDITAIILLKQINININNPYHIYFIIDSCFSKKFIVNYIPYKISYITYIVSSMEDETSRTIAMDYDNDVFDKITINKSKYFIISIFTYYFVKLIRIRKYNIDDFDKIPSDKLWKMIAKKYKQNIYYEHFSQTL
jgi:hypothetical protein